MSAAKADTLRLIFPQWQGGNNPPYYLGAQLLAWLAPDPTGPVEQVAVSPPTDDPLEVEQGLVARQALLEQACHARTLIEKYSPRRVITLGGDCLVDLVPFSYLSSLYRDDLAILWVDAHPDIMTPEQFNHAHAMVLGNLMGYGDPDFVEMVPHPINHKKSAAGRFERANPMGSGSNGKVEHHPYRPQGNYDSWILACSGLAKIHRCTSCSHPS